MTNELRQKIERAIVTKLIEEVGKVGFVPECVWDGEEHVPVHDVPTALDAIFSVDESTLHFTKFDKAPNNYGVFLVCGNGEEIISDWHCGDDAFNEAIEAVCDKIESIANFCLVLERR